MSKPKVVIYGSCSVDGRITLGRDRLLLPWGDAAANWQRWEELAGPASDGSEALEWLRWTHEPQSHLEGSESFVTSGAGPVSFGPFHGDPTSLYGDYLPEDVVSSPERKNWLAVPDSRGRVRWSIKQSEGVHVLVLAATATPPEYLSYLRSERIPYLVAGSERVDLAAGLEKLAASLGVRCVICQSPGKLAGALMDAGLVDEVNLDIFPAVIGGFDTPVLFRSPEHPVAITGTRLELLSAQVQTGGRVWLRYRVL